MFSYNPKLTDSTSRIRYDLGDTEAPGYAPDETIQAMIARHTATSSATTATTEPNSASTTTTSYAAGILTTTTITIANGIQTTSTTTINEAAATADTARGLAARYASLPDSIADAGQRLTWANRVAQWNRIAEQAAGGAGSRTGRGFRLRRGPAIDYTAGAGDQP